MHLDQSGVLECSPGYCTLAGKVFLTVLLYVHTVIHSRTSTTVVEEVRALSHRIQFDSMVRRLAIMREREREREREHGLHGPYGFKRAKYPVTLFHGKLYDFITYEIKNDFSLKYFLCLSVYFNEHEHQTTT